MAHRLMVQGHSFEARWFGASRAVTSPIVMLHEGLGSLRMWRDFPEALAARTARRVLAYSRLGHGASDLPSAPHTSQFMHEEGIDWLPAILDAAGIQRAVLFGHSDGGSIALIFAATFPARVEALVLEAPHVFVEDISTASIARVKTQYESTDLRDRLGKYHQNVDAAFRGWSDVWLRPEFRQWNIEAFLPRIACPVLLIQGEQDEYGTLRQVEAIEKHIQRPVESLILADCGHSPHRDQPGAVLRATASFLKTQQRCITRGPL